MKSVPLDAANQKSLHKSLCVLGPLRSDGQAAVLSRDYAITPDTGYGHSSDCPTSVHIYITQRT